MNEQSVFIAALEREPSERTAFLDDACAGNLELRRQVDRLLLAHEQAANFMAQPAAAAPVTIGLPMTEGLGTVIGPYKLMEPLGEGGMGLVFVAEQQQPVRRKVALKVIKPGMDTRQVVARFEAERQALALMDHPNIAKVLEAGATESGRPYFVMELVKGVPITQFCDDNRLSPRERLELFIHVCAAVQHAHHKGVIHRDIKPSNVMVSSHDGTPVVKVIDFGVAKAIGQQLSEKSVYTALAQLVGTPLYMSPEQAGQSSLDVDTRSDIYSLGVLLYELLTGTTPFDKERFKEADYDEIRRIIREEEPPKPSTRISTLGQLATTLSTQRKSDPKRLSQLFRGELDWIVMKALEKDRNRRYETANGFAADVQRYLADEPVQACPPSVGYRLRKFVRRNKGPVLAAALVLLALVGGIVGTTLGLIEARRQRDTAETAEQAEKKAKETAVAREAEIKAVLDFVENKVFAAARPKDQEGGQGYDVKLADAVKAALPFVEGGFKDQPLIEARLRMTLGTSFLFLGDAKRAEEQIEKARAICAKLLGPDHPDTLMNMNNLAVSYAALGRHTEALKLREETLALQKIKLGSDHPDTLHSMGNLANSYADLARHADALKLREETLALIKGKLGPDHPDTLFSMNNLALSYAALGRRAEALKLYEETLALRKAKLGPDHPGTLRSMHNLANTYYDLGRHTEAVKLHEETLALMKGKLGPVHPDTLGSMQCLAVSYDAVARYADAFKLYEETLTLYKAKLGLDHPDTLGSMHNLAFGYAALGRQAEALKLYEETLALRKAKLGPDHPGTLDSMYNLANTYYAVGRHAHALKLHEEALALKKAKLGPDHPATLRSMSSVAGSYATLGRHAEALKLKEETLSLQKAKLGPDHPDTLWSMNNLACSYTDLGRHTDALRLHEETLALRKVKLGADHPDTHNSMHNLAVSYAALGRHADALRLNEETLALWKAKLGPDHPSTLGSMQNLASSYDVLGRHGEALKLREEALTLNKAKLGPDHPHTLLGMYNLAKSYSEVGRHTDALKLREETLALMKAKLGPDHPHTLHTMWGLAETLIKLDQGAEAVPIIDECVQRAAGKIVPPRLIPSVMDLRLRHFEKGKDAAGCRTTAEMWEKLNRSHADSLYDAACFRAVTAAVVNIDPKTPGADAARLAKEEADRAMAWLKQAVAAGYKDAGHIKEDKDLDPLRDREDFKKLLAELEQKQKELGDRSQRRNPCVSDS